MKKVRGLISLSVLAALGMLGLQAQAAMAGDPQPDCQGQPAKVNFAWIDTRIPPDLNPNENEQLLPAEVWGGAVLCGSDTQTEHGYPWGKIESPALHEDPHGSGNWYGQELRCANPDHPSACTTSTDLASERYVGDVEMDLMAWYHGPSGDYYFGHLDNDHSKIYVNHAPGYTNSDCAATYDGDPVVQCLQGMDDLHFGIANIIVTKYEEGSGAGAGTGRYRMYILQPQAGYLTLYYTKVGSRGAWNQAHRRYEQDPADTQQPMHICRYAGSVGGSACGSSSSDWMQKNGKATVYGCAVSGPGYVVPRVGWWIRASRNGWGRPWASKCLREKWERHHSANGAKAGKGHQPGPSTAGRGVPLWG